MYYDANLFAIVVASLGGVIFSEVWMSSYGMGALYQALNLSPVNLQLMTRREKFITLGSLFAIQILVASALYFLLLVTRAKTLGQIMTIAFLVWAGFYLSRVLTEGLWLKRSTQIMLLEGCRHLCVIASMVLIMSVVM